MLLPFGVWFNYSACDEMLNNMCDGSVSPVLNIFSGIHIMIITLFWKTQAVDLVCLRVPEWPFLLRIWFSGFMIVLPPSLPGSHGILIWFHECTGCLMSGQIILLLRNITLMLIIRPTNVDPLRVRVYITWIRRKIISSNE
jgi:hypothetical protein